MQTDYRGLGDEKNEHCRGCGFDMASCICSERRRRQHVPECAYCARFKPTDMFPPHDASRNCESGHYDHCTCDTCF